jgi:hypothetical protein
VDANASLKLSVPSSITGSAAVGQMVCAGYFIGSSCLDQAAPSHPARAKAKARSRTFAYASAGDRQVRASGSSCSGPAGKCLASRHRCGREPGAAHLRVRGGMGLVQRGRAARSARTIAGATLAGSGARVEVPPLECSAGSAPDQSDAGTRHKMDYRGGHQVGQRTVWAG